jgi:hypothetical protein
MTKGLIKWSAAVLIFIISGCAREQPNPIPDTFNSLDSWQVHASNQIRAWVPLGTDVVDAQHTMEQHNFTIFTNSSALLGCDYWAPGTWKDPIEEQIRVFFYLNDGKVSNDWVGTFLTGP